HGIFHGRGDGVERVRGGQRQFVIIGLDHWNEDRNRPARVTAGEHVGQTPPPIGLVVFPTAFQRSPVSIRQLTHESPGGERDVVFPVVGGVIAAQQFVQFVNRAHPNTSEALYGFAAGRVRGGDRSVRRSYHLPLHAVDHVAVQGRAIPGAGRHRRLIGDVLG